MINCTAVGQQGDSRNSIQRRPIYHKTKTVGFSIYEANTYRKVITYFKMSYDHILMCFKYVLDLTMPIYTLTFP